jgi:GNAT superfamily N-acetyltransferase
VSDALSRETPAVGEGSYHLDVGTGEKEPTVIRPSTADDFEQIYQVINDAALAYKGVIPDDRWHDPYMTRTELQDQIDDGVKFFCYWANDKVLGVMGIQDKTAAYLIRHAYVLTNSRSKGIGSKLLKQLTTGLKKPILVGTWKDAIWAIAFYLKNGFRLVAEREKEILLRKYWNIPERQIETSVVLSDGRYEREKNRLLARRAT